MKVCSCVHQVALMYTLYPTWFRWKCSNVSRHERASLPLYPTWFRWKGVTSRHAVKLFLALYPTWFRWKVLRHYHSSFSSVLYIPHGSDESRQECLKNGFWNALYPTWFRWKADRQYKERPCCKYFISHMVQMKVSACSESIMPWKIFISHMVQMKVCRNYKYKDNLLTLYPTWFRWKLLYWFR